LDDDSWECGITAEEAKVVNVQSRRGIAAYRKLLAVWQIEGSQILTQGAKLLAAKFYERLLFEALEAMERFPNSAQQEIAQRIRHQLSPEDSA
jgi:hypothetical protein